ncbi:hypothetical protein QWY82_05800 [Simiduia curdlanivorans]|uniref:DUF4397 domain-containing protein n=1 Tax=Simiduia curdlanivorans TaxID=1492769 RepID=A0ABV8V5G5_9GAMM|nr:DUF4397 domain-containing protein [Simiduia curdlanivorans]MDN3638325.1 hypothetical protein [Simiduia curdlanivorans]
MLDIIHTRKWLARISLLALMPLMLVACDDDDDSTSVDDRGYLQFYNASSNSSTTQFRLDDELVGSAPYGDVTALAAIELDDYTLTLERADTSDASNNVVVVEQDLTISKDDYTLWAMFGDFTAPELVAYDYEPSDDFEDDQFELMAYNFTSSSSQLEIYYAPEDGSFDEASYLTTLGAREQSATFDLEEGDYTFHVIEVDSGELILSTAEVPFVEAKTYFVVLRDDDESTDGTISLDQVTTSTFVYNYTNENNAAQLRVYNSIDELGSVDILLTGRAENPSFSAIDFDSASEFQTMPFGDYTLAMTEVGNPTNKYIENKLVSLASGASKNVVFYKSTSNVVSALVFSQDVRERVYEHDINLLSFANKLDSDGDRYLLKAYFVNEAEGETLESAAQVLTGVDFAKVRNFTLVSGDYAVYITYTDDDGVEQALVDDIYLELEANTNYMLILEPDSSAYGGYRISVVQ